MKKLVMLLVFGILVLSLVGAVSDNAQVNSGNGNSEDDEQAQTNQQTQNQGEEDKLQFANRIRVGDYETENGKKLQIQEKANKQIQLKVRNVSAHTGLNITSEQVQNRTRLKVKLSNGVEKEIKIMPDVASEKAIERLKLKVCSEDNNCSIELKEVGSGDGVKVAYEVQTRKQVKFWGLFRTYAQVRAQVDAENGEVIQVSKPWWAVLVDELDE